MIASLSFLITALAVSQVHASTVSTASAPASLARTSHAAGAVVVDNSADPYPGSYTTIQAGVDALSATTKTPQTIFIFPGTYTEQVYIRPIASNLTVQGFTPDASNYSDNTVTLTYNLALVNTTSDDLTATLRQWNTNTKVYNLNVVNTFGHIPSNGQNLAVSAYVANQAFYGCQLIGYQDTLLAEKGAQLYARSLIVGAVDFVFGQTALAWLERVDIRTIAAGTITASGRSTASNPSWYVINNSTVAGINASIAAGSTYLGRPWGAYARVVFQDTYLGSVVAAAGWKQWSASTPNTADATLAEYNNYGPGSVAKLGTAARASFSEQLATPMSIESILGANYQNEWWIDTSYLGAGEATSSTRVLPAESDDTTATTTSASASVCTCTAYSQIASAVASCTNIVLSNIAAPDGASINLSRLKTGTTVTFDGTTMFGVASSSSFKPITLGGAGITVTANAGAVIDGNGQAYWDGQGSNGGTTKPDHFFVVSKVTGHSVIEKLHIRNWPTHLFSITGCSDLVLQDLVLDNTAGNAPNSISGGLAAAHNTDGFDVSSTSNLVIRRVTVDNQDDCVAITSGNNVTVQELTCRGGHGLSIGSVGLKSNNNVTNVLFTDSIVADSQNACRIKTNYGATGFVANITYANISVSGISAYGIDVQQDYLNGGPTGDPSNGVLVQNVLFQNVTGTANATAANYYVLCGNGSCTNIQFVNVSITGGSKASTCNFPSSGRPSKAEKFQGCLD